MKTLVSVSWCASHRKGGDQPDALHLPGQLHAEWLEAAVSWYRARSWKTIVACTNWQGITNVENRPGNCERDVIWRLLADEVPILGTTANPGHQVGAALTIRLGLEYAQKCGYDYLVHTAEDVLPLPGVVTEMIRALERGASYAGARWGPEGQFLNAQFFAARALDLVGPWDACAVGGHAHIEHYLAAVVGQRPREFFASNYRHTHDYEEWRRWVKEQNGEMA